MSQSRIALYIGNELYPASGSDPAATVKKLQKSQLTSPILSLVNQSGSDSSQICYNDATNPIFDTSGNYIGSDKWAGIIANLRGGGHIQEVYLSFSTSGVAYMNGLISSNPTAAASILSYVKNTLGFDGIDLDDESGDYSPGSPLYNVADAAITAGLHLTAAPYYAESEWDAWVKYVQKQNGTVAWLNLQCYAGGKSNNPGTWLDIPAPIVAGSCSSCGSPQTTCSPDEMQKLFTLWTTGTGSVSRACWNGTPNTQPQAIGGGFIWVYSSIKNQFEAYMNAVYNGLGGSSGS